MDRELVKRFIKGCIPWRLRYLIKIQEAKGNLTLPKGIKQHRPIREYNHALFEALDEVGVGHLVGKVICEMGPGEYFSHAAMGYRMGADKEYLLEIADLAGVGRQADISALCIGESAKFIRPLPEAGNRAWNIYLPDINAVYKTNAIDGYKEIPDQSVDYVFSFFVLEHVRKNLFVQTMQEVYRFMKPGALAYHTVDFADHMGGGKNQLRFPENVWENEGHYKMDMYTNRISYSQMCKIVRWIGFKLVKVKKQRYQKLPLKRSHLDKEFQTISNEDLLIKKAVLVLKRNG